MWAIRFSLDRERRLRHLALSDLAIDSKLGGCDVVKVRLGDLVSGGRIRTRATLVQQTTGRPAQFELMEPVHAALLAWLERRGGALDDCAFPSRANPAALMSKRQHARLVDEWVTAIGLRRKDYGTHSLRRTKAPIIYKATGNLRAVQILLGHSKIASMVRYLGVDVEDALHLASAPRFDGQMSGERVSGPAGGCLVQTLAWPALPVPVRDGVPFLQHPIALFCATNTGYMTG